MTARSELFRFSPWGPPAAILLLAALPLAALPLGGLSDQHLRLAAEILILGTAVLSLDLLIGYGGLVSLGQAAMFGVGAYAGALFASHATPELGLVLLAGAASATIVGAVMGALVMRSANLFLLILTLLLSQMVWEVIFRWRAVTGGADGFRGIPPLVVSLPGGPLALDGAAPLYAVAALLAGGALLAARSFVAAPIGRALAGTREQPIRMTALGYSIPRIRLSAFVVSSAIAGAAGALYPFVNLYVGPQVAHWTMSATFVIMLVMGGVGTLYGGYAGAAIYLVFQTHISSYTDRWQLVVGLVFVATVLFVPRGLVRGLRRRVPPMRPAAAGGTATLEKNGSAP